MFDTSFLQVVVFGAVGALLVGPKDLPMVARKIGGILGKGVGFISRTRGNVQSFIKENQLSEVQQDFERSLQQIRQVQDEVKQGLTSPIVQSYHRPSRTDYSSFNEPVHTRTVIAPSISSHSATNFETRSASSATSQDSHIMYAWLKPRAAAYVGAIPCVSIRF
jgi:Sec-independent protein translocase protein TatA